jgi:hypothetical protein
MHKKVVSVSLWGNDPRYLQGAIKNSFLSQKHYPDWEFRIYAETHLHVYLKAIPAKILAPVMEWANGRFWRFAPAFEADVDVVISRDCDSRISQREAFCVEEWIASGKKFHVIRDHERHYDFPMLGGMWGVRGGLPLSIRASISECATDDTAYLVDQIWLGNKVWTESNAIRDVFIHGAKEKTLNTNAGFDFVGQGYDETDAPIYR